MVYRYTKPPSQRQLMVSSAIKHELSAVIMRLSLIELYDLRVVVTEVRVSADLKLATVFVLVVPENNNQVILDYLKKELHFIKKELASVLKLRSLPVLRFVEDKASKQASEVHSLLKMDVL